MNPILQALSAGYGAKEILSYVSKSNPNLARKVEKAIAYGYPAESVLRYVMQGSSSLIGGMNDSSSEQNSLYDQLQYSMPEGLKNAGRMAVGVGATLAGAKALDVLGNPLTSSSIMGEILPTEEQPQQPQPPLVDPEQSKTIFEQIIADYPVESLDEEGQKQLRFLENVANQLEQKGKDITDPGFKKIKKKVSDLFKGKSGIMMQEMARSADMQQEIANQAEPMQPQQGQMVSGMGPGQKALMDILQRIQQRRGM